MIRPEKSVWESNIYSENKSLNQIMIFDLRSSISEVNNVGDKLLFAKLLKIFNWIFCLICREKNQGEV